MLARSAAVRRFARTDAVRLVVATLLIFGTLGAVLAVDALPGPFAGAGSVVGDVATVDILAPRALTYESAEQTRLARDAARAEVPPQYDYTAERAQLIAAQQLDALEAVASPVDAAFEAVLTPEAREIALRSSLPALSEPAKATLSGLEEVQWTSLRAELFRVLEAVERQEVKDTLLPDVRESVGGRLSVRFAADQRSLASEILQPLVVANSTFDAAATEDARNEAANRIDPITISLSKGEILVRRGDRIDDITREKLARFNILEPRPDAARAAGWFMLAGLAVVLLLGWIWRFRPQLWHRNSALLLISLMLIAATIALKVTGDRSVLPYVVPTAAVGLLLAVLLDAGAALMVTGMLALVGGAIVGSVEFAAFVLFGGVAGIIVVRRGEKVTHFIQSAVAIAVVEIAVITLFTLLGDRDFAGFFELAGAAIASAAGAAVFALGSFVILGNAFGITTSFRMLELANPSQPLLRKLLLETPGTYHHSLMVGNLAERAAEAIGADPLLARVAAYYHDVGKLGNPQAFIENQSPNQNIHDELEPDQSVALLKSHVANGIDLAYEYKLPKPVIAFIPQHHGTALMSYFYNRAQEQAVADARALPGTPAALEAAASVDAARFRHAGPKPQSREAAILMLADSVEASVRSLGTPDEPAIRAMVSRIIHERQTDGQFDECDLTLRDLDRIREAFVAQLLGMYHRRIEYPQNKIVELESRRAAGGSA
jgi:putative nucleotidyltransferase with HDIG domain